MVVLCVKINLENGQKVRNYTKNLLKNVSKLYKIIQNYTKLYKKILLPNCHEPKTGCRVLIFFLMIFLFFF